jgi:hypothetical protein
LDLASPVDAAMKRSESVTTTLAAARPNTV